MTIREWYFTDKAIGIFDQTGARPLFLSSTFVGSLVPFLGLFRTTLSQCEQFTFSRIQTLAEGLRRVAALPSGTGTNGGKVLRLVNHLNHPILESLREVTAGEMANAVRFSDVPS